MRKELAGEGAGGKELPGMAEGEDFASAGAEAVNDAVGGNNEFADVGASEFGDHATEAGMGGEGVRSGEETVTPFDGDGGAGGIADVAEDVAEAASGTGSPGDGGRGLYRRPSARREDSTSDGVRASPRSSSASAARTSAMRARVSAAWSKSAGEMRTAADLPFWVTRMGRWVRRVCSMKEAREARNVVKGTTSCSRLMGAGRGMGCPWLAGLSARESVHDSVQDGKGKMGAGGHFGGGMPALPGERGWKPHWQRGRRSRGWVA